MNKYTLDIPVDLRVAIDTQAVLEPGVSSADVARRWLEIGRAVQETGYDNLADYCTAQRNETLNNWTGAENDSD